MMLDGPLWQALADSLGGSIVGQDPSSPPSFLHLSTDTRTLKRGTSSLTQTVFIALKGHRHDGHIYVSAASEMGVKGFILSENWPGPDPKGHVIRVPDTLEALQFIGRVKRENLKGQVVGITGSNGKTTVKEWAHALADSEKQVSRSPGSWNSQMGVPLSLWSLDDQAELHLVEAGISETGEMVRLADIIQPDIGVMVHFGDAHDAHFPNRLEKAREKVRLFHRCKTIILGTQDSDVIAALQESRLINRALYWQWPDASPDERLTSPATLVLDHIQSADGATHITGTWKGQPVHWTLPFEDKASLSNAFTAALIALETGTSLARVTSGLQQLQPIGMRMEHLSGMGGGTIINDTWNHDLDGLATALSALGRIQDKRKTAVILSDLVPFDAGDPNQTARLQNTVEHHAMDRWISVGPQLEKGIPGIPSESVLHFESTESLLNSKTLDELHGWNVLVKGARPFAFERVARALESNPHTTVLDLDMGRLAHNLECHREQWKKPIMGMVKAFAYGAGEAVAVELDRLGIDRLAVAFAEEGIRLRKKGVQCPIMVLNAESQRYDDLLHWELEPEIHNLDNLNLWHRSVTSYSRGARGVHLKVETGMHRLGLGENEWRAAGQRCAELHIPILSVYSHLSAADDPGSDAHTRAQLAVYGRACSEISDGWSVVQGTPPQYLRHMANTAGAARFPEARLDFIRIGLGLYGLDASGTLDSLQPIGRFHTRVSHLHRVPPGEPVGYGAKDVADHERMIATLPVGYADGLPRSAGMGRARLHAAGKSCPTVGPVCMDGCMIDVTGLDISIGDSVEIFGDLAPIEELAKATDTIPYELLCRIPERVRRRHLRT